MSFFYGTEYEILAGFEPVVGRTENFEGNLLFICTFFIYYFLLNRVVNKELYQYRGGKTINLKK